MPFFRNIIQKRNFSILNDIYEFDADLFGSLISAVELMKNNINKNHQITQIKLFNSLTLLLFTTANIIIEYSGNMFDEIFYMKNNHPIHSFEF